MSLYQPLSRRYQLALRGGGTGRRTGPRRLEIEQLEDRLVPAPILTGANNFTPISRTNFTNNGDLVAKLADPFITIFPPATNKGIAVDGVNSAHGTFQYSLDNGATWNNFPAVSDFAALLLRDTDRVRFIPNGQNLDIASIEFRAWDETVGGAGQLANASMNGTPTSAFSGAVAFSQITVTVLPPGPFYPNVLAGDVLGNHAKDVLTFNPDGTWVVGLSQPSGLFAQTWAQWNPASQWLFTGTGDFNGDGKADVIGFADDGTIWVGQSNGSRFITTEWAAFTANPTSWQDFVIGDFTGDGKDDLLAFNKDGSIFVAVANAQGSGFNTSLFTTFVAPANTWVSMQAGDFNHDGKMDLASFNADGSWWVSTSNGTSFTNNLWVQWSPASNWANVFVGDFNGDGKTDIAGFNNDGSWWVGISNGAFFVDQLWAQVSPARNWTSEFVGDADGDGKKDIIAFNNDGTWWTNLSTGSQFRVQEWAQWTPAINWPTQLVSDITGDGKSDILGFNNDGTAWLGQSTGSVFATSRLS